MRIQPLELVVLIDEIGEIDFEMDEENNSSKTTFNLGETDTRRHTFYEIDSFGEYIENEMDLTIIYLHGVEFTCTDTYEQLNAKIKAI